MPTYQYSCSKCGEDLEVYQSFTDAPLKRHKGCGGSLQKIFAPVGIVLKGSGFYKNDSRSGSRAQSEKAEKTETKAESGSSTDAAKADSSSSTNGSKKDGASNGGSNGSDKKPGKGTKPAKQSA